MEEVRERSHRNHLEVAYLGDVVVGNSTVWPPTDENPVARVIARVLPDHRRRGFGEQIYARAVQRARSTGSSRPSATCGPRTRSRGSSSRPRWIAVSAQDRPGREGDVDAGDRPARPGDRLSLAGDQPRCGAPGQGVGHIKQQRQGKEDQAEHGELGARSGSNTRRRPEM